MEKRLGSTNIPKTVNQTLPVNYKPIALVSIILKTMEKAIGIQLIPSKSMVTQELWLWIHLKLSIKCQEGHLDKLSEYQPMASG